MTNSDLLYPVSLYCNSLWFVLRQSIHLWVILHSCQALKIKNKLQCKKLYFTKHRLRILLGINLLLCFSQIKFPPDLSNLSEAQKLRCLFKKEATLVCFSPQYCFFFGLESESLNNFHNNFDMKTEEPYW